MILDKFRNIVVKETVQTQALYVSAYRVKQSKLMLICKELKMLFILIKVSNLININFIINTVIAANL